AFLFRYITRPILVPYTTLFRSLVDPFAGQVDLYNETIKVLHNLSFVEDPTRILRAIRFETRFAFKMDEQTENLALNSIEQMKDRSEEHTSELQSRFDLVCRLLL